MSWKKNPDEELYVGPNASIIHFNVYINQGRCGTHGIIINVPSVCRLCEEKYDINNGIIKSPRYVKKIDLTKFHVLLVNYIGYIITQCWRSMHITGYYYDY